MKAVGAQVNGGNDVGFGFQNLFDVKRVLQILAHVDIA
jgi:hypothetical protein